MIKSHEGPQAINPDALKPRPKSLSEAFISRDFWKRLKQGKTFAILDKKPTSFPDISFVDLEGAEKRPEAWDDELIEDKKFLDSRRSILAMVSRSAGSNVKPSEDDLFRLPRLNEFYTVRNGTFLVLYRLSADSLRILIFREKDKPFQLDSDREKKIIKTLERLGKSENQEEILEAMRDDYDSLLLTVPAGAEEFTDEQLRQILKLA